MHGMQGFSCAGLPSFYLGGDSAFRLAWLLGRWCQARGPIAIATSEAPATEDPQPKQRGVLDDPTEPHQNPSRCGLCPRLPPELHLTSLRRWQRHLMLSHGMEPSFLKASLEKLSKRCLHCAPKPADRESPTELPWHGKSARKATPE